LTVDTQHIDVMTQLGIQALHTQEKVKSEDIESQKRTAIAKCRRRIDAARNLYEDGDLSREEYLKRKEANEREIVHWEAQTAETEKIALELVLCLEAINRINELWEISDDEDKQGMARNLFSSITYNLDTQRIVDFRLKPWADRFVTLRTALYEDENTAFEGNKNPSNPVQGVGKGVVLTGYRHTGFSLPNSAQWLLSHCGILPQVRRNRNEIIRDRFASGEALTDLANEFEISPQRIFQIVHHRNR